MYISATAALYLKCKHFGMTIVRVFSKSFASLMRNYFPKQHSGVPLHTLSKLYDVSVGFVGNLLRYFRLPMGGCCSVLDDLSSSCVKSVLLYLI